MSEITCPLTHAALRYPYQAALIDNTRSVTYAEYNARVSAVADRLRQSGIKSGDRVGLRAPNSIEYIIALMGIVRAGAIACPVNHRLPAKALAETVSSLKLATVVSDRDAGEKADLPLETAPDLRTLVDLRVPPPEDSREWTVSLSRYTYATIVQTSGSAGTPKAALHCYANHYYSALGSNENIPLKPGDRWLLALPLHHVGGIGILFRCLLSGAAVVVADSVDGLPAVSEPSHLTHLSLVPTQMKRMLDDPMWTKTLADAKAILVGGAALHERLIETAHDLRWPLFTTYGMTETSSQHTTVEPGAPLARLYTSGRPLPHRELKLSPEREILVRGKNLFVGYVDGDRIDPAVDDDGWFHTGDIGALDDQGCLCVYGRRDNMFVSGGENIYPEAIERALRQLSEIEDALVVPVPDDEFGARPFAFLKVRSRGQLEFSEKKEGAVAESEALVAEICRSGKLRAHLETELPRFMIPVQCVSWPTGPTEDRLKPERARFRRLAEQIYHRQS